jgi:Phage MuF-C-terminal domain
LGSECGASVARQRGRGGSSQSEQLPRPGIELIRGIGSTPERQVGLGFQDPRLAVKAKTIGKMFFEHGLTQGLIEKIPAILEAPKAIYRSDTHPTNMVVLTYELKAGAPIIIRKGAAEAVLTCCPLGEMEFRRSVAVDVTTEVAQSKFW